MERGGSKEELEDIFGEKNLGRGPLFSTVEERREPQVQESQLKVKKTQQQRRYGGRRGWGP